ncbi:MAG: hypothetical protein QM778_33065 [Myxococcales bacterium]
MSRFVYLLAGSCLLACGGRSDLDDYSQGLAAVVPQGDQIGGGSAGDGDGDGGTGNNGNGNGTGAEVGEPCDDKSDCMGGANADCLKTVTINVGISFDIMFPGGSCTILNCKSDADCPKGTGCLMGFSAPACTKTCEQASDCRSDEGYTCGAVTGSQDQRKFCQPPIDFGGLPGGGGGTLGGGGGFPGFGG